MKTMVFGQGKGVLSFIPKHLQSCLVFLIPSSCFKKKKFIIFIAQNCVATKSSWVLCSFFFIRFQNHAHIRTGNSITFLPWATTLDDCVSAYRLHFMQFAPMKNIKIAKTRMKSLSVSIGCVKEVRDSTGVTGAWYPWNFWTVVSGTRWFWQFYYRTWCFTIKI